MHSATENQRLLNVEHGAGVENGWAFPTSFAQQRLWLLNQLEPHNTAYSIPWSMRLHGDLNVEALEDSLNEIVSRHDVFRTTFRISQGEPIQFVADSLRIRLSKTDLSNWPERESEASRIAQQEADTPLNLESGPLIRSQLIRMSGCDHILLLTIHHIVFDGWSRRIFARELASCYQAFQLGEPSPLAPLPLQYADFAVWQRKLMSGKSFAKQLAYWKEQLANPPAALNLPTDRPRPAVQSHRGGRIPASLSPALSRRVVQFAREYNASIFMVLLAAFHALLSRYSGDEDILVGTPIANRTRPDIENLIGLFANTLVLRGRLAGNPSFAELVRRSKQTALDAYAHQDIPFEKLVEETNPERSLSRNPLFQVMFSLQNAASESFHLSGIEVKVLESKADTAKFDLSIFLSETEDGIRGRVEYNTDLYDRETIERLWKHYVRLLEAAIEKPELPFSQLPLLTDAERDQLLVEWNDTTADYPSSLCVHTWFEQQAERTPQSVACVWEETELSYRELNERANQLAWFLRRLGAAPGERVGVYLKRSAAMLVALLGVQKSGAAYVPLDPAYPAERLRLTLEQAGVTATVTEKELEDGLPEGGTGTSAARRVCLDRDAEAIARENRGNPACLAQPDDLIYVMFTSGSTGRPKGVEVSHRSVVNLLATMAEKLHMGPDDVFPALASFAFDVCIPELYLGLVTGGRVVIGRERLASDGHELAAFLRGVGATVVHATPTSWQLLLEAGFTGAGLKRAIGAEALPAGLSNRLLQADSSLYNFYGPTETTVWSTVHHFQNADEPIVIGRPLANTRIYILDPERQPVPVGVEGELYIGGTGVARGYLNRPDLTAERFLADPFRPGERMYRTGDRARYRSDGRIEYLGRADFQVKLRGYRIELGEIEAVLAQHPMVKQCVATVREDAPGDLRLVAYVVRQHSASAAETEWHRWLKERLPEYMVPAHIVTLENFPLSANGKVDRKQLPKVTYQRGDDEPYFAARTPVQDITAAIWCEVLKLQRVGVTDDFFQLGGHSLLGMQVVSRLREAFGIDLPLRALFEAPTVAGLAQHVEELMLRRHSLIVPPLTRVARPPRIPLSFAQQRLWFIHQLEPGNEQYSIPYLMRLTGRLNGTVLEQSLNEIVRRHEVLRSRFIMEDGEALQVVEPSAAVPFVITDLTKLPADHREQEAHRMVTKEIERPFDLSAAPMFRALLIRLDESDHVFAITLHHAVCDGWSLDVLSEELTAFYDAFLENRSPQLKELAVQYADYTLWQHEFLSSVRLEKEIEYWKQQLAGAPAILNLPCDRPRPPRPTLVGAQASVLLPAALLEELKRLGHGEGATLFMTLLATLNVLLWRYSGQDDIAVGCPIAGRNRVELEPLIGFFVNTLVLRTSLAGNPTFRNLLNRVRQTALNAYAHQDLPFEKLVGEMNPTRDAAQNPLFRVAFVLQNMPRQNRKIGELAVTPFAIKTSKSKFDLTLIAHEQVDGLRLNLQYSTDLFDEQTIGRMLQHYQALLECIVKEPDLEISDLSFLTASEQHLLFDWGSATSEYARESSIQHLFDQQAATRENAVALECGETGMTYGELQHRANQFAHYLRCRGIGTGALVSICMERSIELVVTILGILKAGAAYVPLDPDYPPERLSFMLEDTCAALLVTQDRLLEDVASTLGTPVICLDRDRDLIARQQPTQQLPIGAPDDLAYVMYTSGSTGRPKGVAVPHRGVVRLVNNPNYASFTPEDVLLQFAPISFDASTLEIWGALLNGAKLVISPSRNASLDELATTIQGKGITTLWLTAGLFHLMVEHHLKRLRGVRQLLAGGDVLSISHVRRAVQELQGCRIINGYGPTENTTFTCCHTITLDTIGASVPIGRPLSNTQVYILDERQKLVPIGVVGELCTGGDGLARAYVNSPELTKERFVEVNGLGRLYRTGDRCRWRSDGLIEFVGRLDNQVKLRGYRIELGEVEAALNQQPGVAQSVAVIREDKPGVRQLVAYVLPQPGSPPQNGNLLGHLRKSLPEFMVPAAVIVIDEFPLGPNGKIDRRALPKPEMTLAQEARLSGPRDEFEHRLLHIWKQVLGVNSCSLTDNFFELGGHSLLLLRLEAMIEKEFKKVVPLSFLFRSANIESIAAFLRIDSKPEPEIFVPLKEQGAGPAFFCVHEVMGEVMMFRHFAKFLNPDQRFFGVQFPPEERAPECVTSIEAVAARYVDALLAFQPEGPYLLGGWSAGASVALEMAQQLQARGRNVGLLVAIDAAPPNTGVPESRKTLRYYCDLVRNVPRWIADELIATFSWRQFFIRAVRRLSSPVKRVLANRRGSDARIKYTIDRINKAGNYPERTRVFIDAFYRILLRYKPKPYNGRVVLYKAMTQDLSSLREPERVWKALATHVDVVPVRGTHVSLLEERHCQQFADDLNARLKPFRDSWADKKRTVNHPPDREPSMSLREESTVADLEWSRSAVVQS